MSKKNNSSIELFKKMDETINMDDVVNVLVSEWETKQTELIRAKTQELDRLLETQSQIEKKALDILLKLNSHVDIPLQIGNVTINPVIGLSKSSSYYEQAISKFDFGKEPEKYRIKIDYIGDTPLGKLDETFLVEVTTTRKDSNELEQAYQENDRLEESIKDLKEELRNLKHELVMVSVKERKLKAQISKTRLESNKDFQEILKNSDITKLLEPSSDSIF